jgi:hypothetical protein
MLLHLIAVGIPLLAMLMMAVFGGLMLIKRLRQKRFQYSLRTLLIFVTAIAVLLSAIASWNLWFKAQIEFLDPDSLAVAAWNAPPVITEEKGDFNAVYHTRCLSAGEIQKIAKNAMDRGNIHGYTSYSMEGTITVMSGNREKLEETLAEMQQADIALPDRFTIRGIVKDAAGDPLPGAAVELAGHDVPFNSSIQSRGDGTFSMPVRVPARSGYYFQIYYGKKKIDSTTFSLDSARPEIFVEIRVR